MKHIKLFKKFNKDITKNFVNESLRDKMTGKSSEEIIAAGGEDIIKLQDDMEIKIDALLKEIPGLKLVSISILSLIHINSKNHNVVDTILESNNRLFTILAYINTKNEPFWELSIKSKKPYETITEISNEYEWDYIVSKIKKYYE